MTEGIDAESLQAEALQKVEQTEPVKKSLDADEYETYLVAAGKTQQILQDRAKLHDFLHGIGINFKPDFEFGEKFRA